MSKETTAATDQQLQDLYQRLYKELTNSPLQIDNCIRLMRKIHAATPTVRTRLLHQVLTLAQRKAVSTRSREFRLVTAAVERGLEGGTRATRGASLKHPDQPKAHGSSKTTASSLPRTVTEYMERLKRQDKELYKNPPVLPPTTIQIYETSHVIQPKRDKSGTYLFSSDADIVKQFRPNRSPEEVLHGGAFGGTYFRSIHSAVTNQHYHGADVVRDTLADAWWKGLNESRHLTHQKYDASVNKFGVKCGGSLGMWESSGWISDVDPYGWFQWYCRFFQGRRTSDDVRQIQRWMGVAGRKGRFKSQLCNKIIAADTHVGDTSISPVIRQTMWHWGLEITNDILEQHRASRK